jgi:hypothetical protein
VGIGTSSPNSKLDIGGGTSGQTLTFSNTALNTGARLAAAVSYKTAGYTGKILESNVTGSFDDIYDIRFFTANTGVSAERMRIDSSGNLLVGKTALPSASVFGFAVNNSSNNFPYLMNSVNTTGTGTHFEFYNPNGAVGSITTNGSATSYVTSSDYRLKKNVAPMTGALDKVMQLKPCTYTWKIDGSSGQGFIAHELQEVVSECVTGEKDGMRTEQYEVTPETPATFNDDGNELTPVIPAVMGERELPQYQGVDTSFLVATLTAAIQELKAEFDAYKLSHP